MIEVERSDAKALDANQRIWIHRAKIIVSTTDPDVTPVEGRKRAAESS